MDPALHELIAEGAPEDEVAVVVRLNPKARPPAGLRIVARFGRVATARAARQDLRRLHADPAIASMKAPRVYGGENAEGEFEADESDPDPTSTDLRRPQDLPETGAGTVVAVLDWGCDFAHPDFRNADGSTRLIALWDQRADGSGGPYGYGRIHSRAAINRALAEPDPFAALGYRPSLSSAPAHGTHVLGIAVGNGRGGGPAGVAPEADICFVHLGSGGEDLGSSIEILEGLHFAAKCAGNRPLAGNLSVGRIAGNHFGTSLVERAMDWLLVNRPGTAIAQSTGNYYARNTHMSGQLRERQRTVLPFRVGKRDSTPISVEIWYRGADELAARMRGPEGAVAAAALGSDMPVLTKDGREIGHFYHRREDPNSGDNMINLFLYEAASSGDWEIGIEGIDIVDGRWHAWIERNSHCPKCQAQFHPDLADPRSTTGSICNALRTIAVGAYDAHDPEHRLAPFSSAGPTRDGRPKPLLVAPGVRVLSVRSRTDAGAPPSYARMSGTSMAAPHVAGTLALMMQAAGRQRVTTLRQLLFSTLQPAPDADPRWGYGKLDIAAAVAAARAFGAGRVLPPREEAEAEASEPAAAPAPALPGEVPAKPPERADILALLLGQQAGEADPATLLSKAIDPEDPAATVIGWPRRRLALPLEMGDVVVRQSPGGQAHAAVVEDPALLSRADLAARGLVGEGPWNGSYVRVVESGARAEPIAWRVAGPDGFVLPELSILRLTEPGETVPPPPAPHPTIRRHSTGPAVAEAQDKLNRVHTRWLADGSGGIDKCPLAIDGNFGPLTQQAVLSFQRRVFADRPSEWDGVVGPKTWAMLDTLAGVVIPPDPPIIPPIPPIIPVGSRSVVPVIVLPGVMGTRLRFLGAKLPDWDPNSSLTMLRWFRQDGAEKLRGFDFRNGAQILDNHKDASRRRRGWGALAEDFYDALLLGLEKELATASPCATRPLTHPVWAFGYDWRQPNASHAQRLSNFIDAVLNEEGGDQVILVTHSMGGLVARAALGLIEQKVMGIVHTVQPAVGAVAAARRVHTGYEPSIDGDLGELLQELAETAGADGGQVATLLARSGDPAEASAIANRLMTALFSDGLSANPTYYGRLMARMPSAVELMPSDAAGVAKPDWMRPAVPAGSIHDHYKTAAVAKGGLILPSLPAADAAQFRKRLDEAKAFHAGLRYHARTGVLYANGLKTDNAFDPAATPPSVIERAGDGTVAAFSARCPDLTSPAFRVGFPRVEHGECFQNKAFLKATIAGVDHIAQGLPPLPGGKAPNRESCLRIV
jgi:subtilisin family serine protease